MKNCLCIFTLNMCDIRRHTVYTLDGASGCRRIEMQNGFVIEVNDETQEIRLTHRDDTTRIVHEHPHTKLAMTLGGLQFAANYDIYNNEMPLNFFECDANKHYVFYNNGVWRYGGTTRGTSYTTHYTNGISVLTNPDGSATILHG